MTVPPPPAPTLPEGSQLPAVNGHGVWFCEGGDAAGLPVLIVHGGPGGASRVEPAGWFSGLPVRWLALDQRGCGRSTPPGEISHNRLPDLVDDMEQLRVELGVDRWALAGGSWGARVALAYALAHPDRVVGLMLRSPFLAGQAETRRYIAPWHDWLGPEGRLWLGAERCAAVHSVYSGETEAFIRDTGLTREIVLSDTRTAQAWSAFDDAQSAPGGVVARSARWSESTSPAVTPALMASWAIHAHYGLRGWGALDGVPQGVLVPEMAAGSPVSVVWGAEDATCDPAAAKVLCEALCAAGLGVHQAAVSGAGHRMTEPRLAAALASAAQDWVSELRRTDRF